MLAQWRYTLLETPAAGDTLLVEEGCQAPADASNVLWLTRSRCEGHNRLGLPLPVEELWRRLEVRHHQPTRSHIRIPVQLEATLQARGESTPVQVVSLSDLGVRFDFPRELVGGEQLALEMTLEGDVFTLAGRVIYVVPRGELGGTGKSEIGMIFDRTPQATRSRLREYIVWRCLALARRQVPEPLFRQGLDFFEIPQAVLERLEEPAHLPPLP